MPGGRQVGTGWRAATLVARTELRRTWRSLADTDRRALKAAALGVLALFYVGGAVVAAYVYGETLSNPEFGLGTTVARAAALVVVVAAATTALQRTVKDIGRPDGASVVLTAATHKATVVGLAAAELGRYLAVAAPVFAGIALGFAVATGSAFAAVFIVTALALAVAVGVAVGYVAGLAAAVVGTRAAFVARHRSALGLLAAVSFPVGYAVVWAGDPRRTLAILDAIGRWLPVAWLGDAALAPVADGGLRALAGVLAAAGVVAACVPAGSRLAATLWFATSPWDAGHEPTTDTRLGAAAVPLADRLPRTSRRVAVKSLLRAVRSPFTVQYAVVPAFFLFGELVPMLQTGRVPERLPAEVALAGAVSTGAAFTLNPIGNEDHVLPVTLTSGVDGRAFVAGLAAAELLVGAPATAAAVVVAGALSPLGWPATLALATASVALCVAATGVAARFGARYPNHDPTTMGRGRATVVPSPWAFLGYVVAMVVVCAPALVVHLAPVAGWLADAAAVGEPAVRTSGLLASLVLAALSGYGGLSSAVETVENYRLG
jgi:hypothetical protein